MFVKPVTTVSFLKNGNSFKLPALKIFIALLISMLAMLQSGAQNFPSSSSCTSKDLRLVSATLPYSKCETCTPGSTITKPLTVGINNKTGSTRTSFAFWATLTITNANGTIASSTSISGCFATIPKNATTYYAYGNISYVCGQSLALTNIWEAWTDASPGATCPALTGSPSTINPKCGIDSLLPIISGDDALYTITNASCTSLGSVLLSPIGGTAPYTVKLYDAAGITLLATSPSIAAGGSYTFGNLAPATYTFKITDANNCTPVVQQRTVGSTGSVLPPTSGGDQSVCALSPVQTLTATATVPQGVTLTWYNQASSGNTVANPTLSSVGTVTYYAQASNGTCTSASRTAVSLTIKPTPAVPTVSTTAATCSAAGTATITNYSAANTYTFTPAGPSAGAGGVISGMTVGTSYTVVATNGVGCPSVSSSSFSIGAQLPTPAVPTVSTAAATCSAAGTATITNYDGANTYTFIPAGPSAGAGGTINGMTAGASYTVTATNGSGCTSGGSSSFSIGAQLQTPVVPTVSTTAATCFATGTATILNYSAANTYTFTPSGPSAGAGGTISGMTAGTSYTVTATNGSGCTSGGSSSFSIGAQLPTPAVPTVSTTAASCSAAGTATITNYSGANTYTFTPVGPSAGAGGTISGMTAGTSYTVTATNGSGCTSGGSSSFSIGGQLPTPAVPTVSTTTASCSAAGTATITNYSGANTYAFTPAGPSAGAGGTISGMTAGTSYTVTATNSSGCTSDASLSFSIEAQLATPSKPDVNVIAQPTCNVSTGTAVITSSTAGLTFSLDNGSFLPYPSGGYSGLASGPHSLKAKNSDGCISDAANFSINQVTPPPSIVSVCLTQPSLCSSSGSVTITASGGSNLQYSIDNGTSWQSSNVFNNLGSGSVTGILVKDLDNGCVSPAAGCEELNCGSVANTSSSISKTGTLVNPFADTRSNNTNEQLNGDNIAVSAYPNPFNKSINFRFVSPVAGKARMEIFDVTGKRIAVVFEGAVKAGASTTVSFNAANSTNQTLVYKLSVDGKMVRGKVQQLR